MTTPRTCALLVFALALPLEALAQPLGTFRWQLQPYCNVVTVNVTQQGGIYTLDGTDDRCGAQPGSAVGIASLTPSGLVGLYISSVLPNGTPVHTEATIDLATLSGTWRDSAGNTGTFVFTPGAAAPGAPRPVLAGGVAPASITNIQIASNAITSANIVDASITAADILDGPRAAAAGGNQTESLTAAVTVLRSVSLTAPAAGIIIANASGYVEFSSAGDDLTQCSVTTDSSDVDFDALSNMSDEAANNNYTAYAATRAFTVGSAGTTTIHLVCRMFSGTSTFRDSNLNAIFVATP